MNQQVWITAEMSQNDSLLFSFTDFLKENELNIDMIASVYNRDRTYLSLSVWEKPGSPVYPKLEKMANRYLQNHLQWHENYSKITLVGARMRNTTGVASSIFQVVPAQDVHMVTTSEISVSLLTPTKSSLPMIEKIAKAFSL